MTYEPPARPTPGALWDGECGDDLGFIVRSRYHTINAKLAVEVCEMKVWVVMGNDYPDSVFDNVENAERYCEAKMKHPDNIRHRVGGESYGTPRIYWRSYEFDVQ